MIALTSLLFVLTKYPRVFLTNYLNNLQRGLEYLRGREDKIRETFSPPFGVPRFRDDLGWNELKSTETWVRFRLEYLTENFLSMGYAKSCVPLLPLLVNQLPQKPSNCPICDGSPSDRILQATKVFGDTAGEFALLEWRLKHHLHLLRKNEHSTRVDSARESAEKRRCYELSTIIPGQVKNILKGFKMDFNEMSIFHSQESLGSFPSLNTALHDHFGHVAFFIMSKVEDLLYILLTLDLRSKIFQSPRFLGHTLLHLACERGYTDLVSVLLEKGVDPQAKTSFGSLPLHYAAALGNEAVCCALMEYPDKFDVHSKDCQGGTALDYARKNGHKEVVKFLDLHGFDLDNLNASVAAVDNAVILAPLTTPTRDEWQFMDRLLEMSNQAKDHDAKGANTEKRKITHSSQC